MLIDNLLSSSIIFNNIHLAKGIFKRFLYECKLIVSKYHYRFCENSRVKVMINEVCILSDIG